MQTPPNTPQGAATSASAPEPDGEKHSSSKGFNLSRWALQHVPLTRYLLIMLLVLGIGAYFQLGQDEDPPFTFRAMVVSAAWPGATAQQMAEQVTDKVERTLQDVPNADKIVSYSKPGEMLVILNLREDTRPQDVPQTWLAVRKKVGDMRASLPQGVLGPFYNDDFGDVYGVIYALQGEGYSYAELKEYADSVRQSLLRVKDVAKVELFGVQDEKLYIEISRSKLAQLGLDMNQVIAQLGQQNAVQSGGEVQAGADRVQVEVTGEFRQLDDVKAMPIRGPNGNQLKLGDIADIYRSYLDPAKTKVHFQGQPTVALGISMRKGGDVIALGKHLHEAVDKIAPTLPAGLSLENVQDQPKAVSTSVNEFVRVLIEAVVIVLAVSFVSLGMHIRKGKDPLWRRITLDPRPGLVVGITIPLVLCATFLAMWYWGIGLHKVSLGSLIIALGLLVDDAIIAVEMMVRKMEEGYDKLSAATAAYDITAKPMLTGTLITAAGFMPIGIAKSTTGEYTFAIFAVTVIALVISWVASVYFVPYLGTVFLKKPRHAPQESEGGEGGEHAMFDTPFYNRFRRTVSWCVEHRWLTIGATVLVFALGLFGMSRVQQQFFPDSNRTEILMDVWLPEGSSMAANEEVTRRIEQRMQGQDGIESVTSWIGSGVPRFYLPLDQIFPQSNVSQLILLPHNLADRDRLMKRLPTLLAQEFPEVRARVKLLPSGPPVPYPVQFRVMGQDPKLLRTLASEVRAKLEASPDMRGVNDNWNESIKVLRLEVDQSKARALGVSNQSIAQATRTQLSGNTIGQFREGDKLIDMVLRQPVDERQAVTDVGNAYVASSSGQAILLSQIAKPSFVWEPGILWRQGREYAITVQGDVAAGLQGPTVTQKLWPDLQKLQQGWADKGLNQYRIEIAGAVEESAKGSDSIMAGMPIMVFIVFTLLMLQLHSFSRSVLVYITGFLGIAGVTAALLLLNRPFGFVALLGVIALMGMIQRNSVILIDQIEANHAAGLSTWDAIVEAATHRLRPIALTAAAAVLAMIPLSRSIFWGPMAVAIMGGLVVATVLTLLALPAMYAAWFRVKKEHSEVPLSAAV
ncbi:efflux RND transporter permease subunit [Comamonas squillarum]|uniref:Efflux RND transporter permease subunit n=1 Tax=Comamonas squillarum TaxID=2977320 RepID=A0ABY6A0B2_9BURK|nr:efflux RND transporter permease subunit [Comamonas sp. PR12]UXC18360.1 efflux RND transporter permease subunit [Comamonas sp. PR12]